MIWLDCNRIIRDEMLSRVGAASSPTRRALYVSLSSLLASSSSLSWNWKPVVVVVNRSYFPLHGPYVSTAPSPCLRWASSMVGNSAGKATGSQKMKKKSSNKGVITSGHLASSSASNSGGGDREILVQHLLVKEDNLKLVSELQQKIGGGEDLSDLAVEYSICPSREQGGMLGWVRRGQMVQEFEEAAFNAPLNKVTRCKTKFGWHLLEVLSEREATLLQEIEPEELHVKMQDPSFLEEAQLIDVREPEEVAQASLPGFLVLPLRQFGSWSPEITTKFDPQKDTYVMCHHGVRSLQVAKWLLTQGFKRVSNVTGGIHAYAVKADPSVSTY